MGKSRGRGSRGNRPAQEEIAASEEGAAARRAAAAAAESSDSEDDSSEDEGRTRRVSGVAHLIEQVRRQPQRPPGVTVDHVPPPCASRCLRAQANPNDKKVKSAVKISELGSLGERSEMKGREKRVRLCYNAAATELA